MKSSFSFCENSHKYGLSFDERFSHDEEEVVFETMEKLLIEKCYMTLLGNDLKDGVWPRFMSKSGSIVTLVIDDLEGISVESEDKSALEKIKDVFDGLANEGY